MTIGATPAGTTRRSEATADGPAARAGGHRLTPFAAAVAALVAVQGLTYGLLAAAGYFYQDDFDFTAAAAGRRLGWGYLSEPVNTHFTPGLRLTYWLFAHLAPYRLGPTIAWRAVMLAAGTVAMARLLVLLLGRRPAVLGLLGWYAFSMLTLPSYLSLSSAVDVLPAHVGVILLVDGYLRYALTRRLRHAAVAAAGLTFAVLFWEKTALAVLLLPLLGAGWAHRGTVRRRLAGTARDWPAWLAVAVPLAGFFCYYLIRGYATAHEIPGPATLLHLVDSAWADAVAPALLGGPWHWYHTGISFSIADPLTWQVAVGLAGLATAVAVGLRRRGPRSLLAWSLPVIYLAASTTLVAAGRYATFGGLIATSYHYLSEAAVPVLVACVLAWWGLDVDAARRRALGEQPGGEVPQPTAASGPASRPRWRVAVVAAGAAAYLASFGWSAQGFERTWTTSSSKSYVTTLLADLRAAGPISMYDTPASPKVLGFLSSNRRLSQLLAPLGLPIRWDDTGDGEPRMVDARGHLVPGRLYPLARSTEQPGVFCSHGLRGTGTLRVPVHPEAPDGDYVVEADYLLERTSDVTLRLETPGGVVTPVRGGQQTFRAGLNAGLLETGPTQGVTALLVSSRNPNLSLCLTAVTVGYPLPDRLPAKAATP